MDHNAYKTNLKNKYLNKIRPLESVNSVISAFQKKIDIVETELTESESIFLKMTILNYANSQNIGTEKSNMNFVSYEMVRNEKSDYYYNIMKEITSDNERILIIIESKLNVITSNCEEVKVEMLIERGIDTSHITQETPEFFAYLMLFESHN